MAKNNEIFDIEQIKKTYKNALEKTAQRIGREIEKAYEAQITRFYYDYTPIVYERTGLHGGLLMVCKIMNHGVNIWVIYNIKLVLP